MLKLLSGIIIAISSFFGLSNEKPMPLPIPSIELPALNYEINADDPKVDIPIEETEKTAINEDKGQELGAGGGETATNTDNCSCISFVRKMTSFTFPRVKAAKEIPVLNYDPLVGSVALFRPSAQYSQWGHAALVTEVASTTFKVSEFNYEPCKITFRTIQKNDPLLRGFFDTRH